MVWNAPNGRRRRFLVVEDEADIADLLRLHLQDLDATVEICHNGRQALDLACRWQWNLIVLDLRLPEVDGLEICKAIRGRGADVPILMLTARSTEMDRVLGLEIGADDYLTKPFSPLELVARAKALLRRAERPAPASAAADNQLAIDDLVLDRSRHVASVGGKRVDLTAREFDLLWHFASHPGRVFTRAELLDAVWGYGHDGYEHTVNSHLNRLRAKIEHDPAHPEYLLTVWGVGYKMREPAP
ncbi:response regulator transcription factor [Ectothiorhodospiraceae bacterium WFHF3C12]|nr:response regulator transcription factor [Ectothiorhodospiraceae bacterium WFHF3C12]